MCYFAQLLYILAKFFYFVYNGTVLAEEQGIPKFIKYYERDEVTMRNPLKHFSSLLVFFLVFSLVFTGTGNYVSAEETSNYATSVYLNGTVVTVDSENTIAEAVAVKDDKIIAVGSEKEIKPYIGKDTKTIDLQGNTLLPGFYDPHGHFFTFGKTDLYQVDLNSPPIGKMETINDYLKALKERAKETPKGEWILGKGYDDTLVAEKRHPNKYDLDKVSTEHPIALTHISCHFMTVNSKALELAGITKDTPNPDGGVIQKDPKTGEPNGVLEEKALHLVEDIIPALSDQERIDAIEYAGKVYAKSGVTTANEGFNSSLSDLNDFMEAQKQGKLPIRAVIWFDYSVIEEASKVDPGTNMITVGGAKNFQDGSIQGYTGYLSKPYYVPFNGDKEYRGYPRLSREELTKIVKKVHNAGKQIFIHGNGDAAIDDILYAIGEAQKENPRKDARHVVIHAQMAREDQLDKMKELGIIPSFFVLHTYYWGDRHHDIFMGPERADRMSPCKSAVDRGMIFTTHCDTPVVPQDPFLSMYAAVNRLSYEGNLIGAAQRITPLDALRSYTINAAYQNFEENIKGSIEKGKLADLVIVDQNPLKCAPKEIKDINVLETIVGGETVYKTK